MSTIHITVGGRSFALSVQPDDEQHVRQLATQIDAKFQQLAPRYSQNLLFASLQLADELHRSQLASAQARDETQQALDDNTALQRDASLALGKVAGLKDRIAELESELGQLQSSIQQDSNKYNDLIADNERFKIAVLEADAVRTRLEGELATVLRERDVLEQQLADRTHGEGPAALFGAASHQADPDLAPALERFAELLENCVTKLEAGPAAS